MLLGCLPASPFFRYDRISLAHIVALAASAVAFLVLTTIWLSSSMHSQTLQIGTLCGALVVLTNIAQVTRRRHASLPTTSPP